MSKFVVYGRPGCGYCSAAVQLLKSKRHPFEYVDIYAQGISRTQLDEIVKRPTRTVPQIVHGEAYVGGYTDLVPYLTRL